MRSFDKIGEEMEYNAVDTLFVLISAALVMLMIPALGFFYGGMVRKKNVLSTILHSFLLLAIVGLFWPFVGYSLAFGESIGGFIGGLEFMGLRGVSAAPSPVYATNIPHLVFMLFQMLFATITPALISGAFAERKKFGSFVMFSVLWTAAVYCPVAHWVWAKGGWLANLGALDFAGGTVVHITSGVSALVCAIMLGKRVGLGENAIAPHNVTMTMTGTALLWFGWFGFNAGSALAVDSVATYAFINTHLAAATGALGFLVAGYIRHKRVKAIGAASGVVAGLVAITPAAGFVTPIAALIMGAISGVTCYVVVEHLVARRVDDALDVFGVHGVGGIVGAILTGVFATTAVNSGGANGLLNGNASLLWTQLLAVVVVATYSALASYLLLRLVDATLGLRVSSQLEEDGLDRAIHGEDGYDLAHVAN